MTIMMAPSSSSTSATTTAAASTSMAAASSSSSSSPQSSSLFTHPSSSRRYDPPTTLASNCILECFGPTVQLVADTIVIRGGGFTSSSSGGTTRNRLWNDGRSFSTLDEIHSFLTSKLSSSTSATNNNSCGGGRTEERRELLQRLQSNSNGSGSNGGSGVGHLKPPPGPCPSINDIRASLLCLIQHSIVTVVVVKNKNSTSTSSNQKKRRIKSTPSVTYGYKFDTDRARYLQRYGRYVECVRSQSKMLDSSVNNIFSSSSSSVKLEEGTSMSATIIHLLLVRGKATTVDIILDTIKTLWPPEDDDDDDDDDDDEEEEENEYAHGEQKQKSRSLTNTNNNEENITDEKIESIMHCLHRLVKGVYFIERVRPIRNNTNSRGFNYEDDGEEDEDPDEGEYEFEGGGGGGIVPPSPRKKPKHDPSSLFVVQDHDNKNEGEDTGEEDHDTADRSIVLDWIRSRSNRDSSDGIVDDSVVLLPPNEVWRVNIPIIQDQIRANKLGMLAFRRHSTVSKYTRWLVMAALRYVSHKKHAAAVGVDDDDVGEDDGTGAMMAVIDETSYDAAQPIILQSEIFTSSELVKYLPASVKDELKQQPGGFLHNLENQLNVLCDVQTPRVFGKMTSAGGGGSSRYYVRTRDMVRYLHDCQQHQFIKSNLGNDAARTVSILKEHSFLESDLVAEKAMMPPKETRDVLHNLFRQGYINLLNLNQGKQYNTSSTIYLWEYNRTKLQRKVSDEVCTALLNMRLRRQHEICRGAQFMDRAATAAANSMCGENEHKADQEERRKFAVGLQRIDNAILSLDELSMTLEDFL